MKTLLAIVSILAGTAAFLVFEVLCMAGGANSSPKQLMWLKGAMIGMLVCWVAGVGTAGWALATGKPGLAASLGSLPLVVAIVLVTIAFVTEF